MKLESFTVLADLIGKSELGKVEYLAYYLAENKQEPEFKISDVCATLFALGFASSNQTRLKAKVKASRSFVKGSNKALFKLSAARLKELRQEFPEITESEEIDSDDSLLPEILLKETGRSYLTKIAQQINAAYENNLFDGCALMMRRLLEVLLIHAFEKQGLEADIQDADGSYQNLKTLINKAKSRREIQLSNDAKKDLDKFRELGNLSAHRVKYNCRRDDIRPVRAEFRAAIEELIYAAGLNGCS